MEGYQFDNKFVAKEIAIVNDDASQCFHYFIKNPQKMPDRPNTPTCYHQFKRHNLEWTFGDYNFSAAISDIRKHIKNEKVFAKGVEKTKFLQKWLPQLEDTVWISTSFKKLNNCFSELCKVKHGIQCARRKVHELMTADKLYKKRVSEVIVLQMIHEMTDAFSRMSLKD